MWTKINYSIYKHLSKFKIQIVFSSSLYSSNGSLENVIFHLLHTLLPLLRRQLFLSFVDTSHKQMVMTTKHLRSDAYRHFDTIGGKTVNKGETVCCFLKNTVAAILKSPVSSLAFRLKCNASLQIAD